MLKSDKFIALGLALLLLLVGPSATFAAPAMTTTHQTVHEQNVTWTLTPAQCSTLLVPLSGTGERKQVINTKVNADGSQQIDINDLVTGTASDSTGTYKFVYHNHSIEEVPPSAGPHQVSMVDSFVLNGNGSVKHMEIGFNWRWTYTPPAALWPPIDNWEQLSTRGDVNCDPL